MAEIKGYILTEEEQKACIDLVKSMREKEKVFIFHFTGSVKIKAENLKQANDFFGDWVEDIEDMSYYRYNKSTVITDFPIFEKHGIEKE